MNWPILLSPVAPGHGVVTSGWASPRTVGSTQGIHGALDYSGKRGDPIYAVAPGEVISLSEKPVKYTGRYVILQHVFPGGLTIASRYIHLDSVSPLRVGQRVAAGQKIGTMGDSGGDWSVHLHLDLRVQGLQAYEDYKRAFGWPTTDEKPAIKGLAGYYLVPSEPLIVADGYRSSVKSQAARYGITLASNRDLSKAAQVSTAGPSWAPRIVAGLVVGGIAYAGYRVWRG